MWVAALVFVPRPVKPHIGKVGGHFDWRVVSTKLKNAQRRIAPPQCVVHVRIVPTGLAELERVLVPPRQHVEKFPKSLQVHAPTRRQLEKNWPKLSTQHLGARQEVVERIFRIFKLFVVRQKSAGFHREQKMFWGGVAPVCEGRLVG